MNRKGLDVYCKISVRVSSKHYTSQKYSKYIMAKKHRVSALISGYFIPVFLPNDMYVSINGEC